MGNTSIRLGEHFTGFVRERVSEGRYGSVSEVVREGLRLLEEREARLKALQRALEQGLDSGVAEDFEFDSWLEGRNRADRRDEAA
ncbi:MAG: type II toxin-antitoxin system ParD family antitoxin [Parasphingopyxis sp.]|nr:type II toxin-antitoxin system ParD family antitoxin [Sphingomonadales bacterium]